MLTATALGATVLDALRIADMRMRIRNAEASWDTRIRYYEPKNFRDILLSIPNMANLVYEFDRRYADRYMWEGTREALRKQRERIYGANGVLANLNEKYLEAMKKGLAENTKIDAPDFRRDIFKAAHEILDAYDLIVQTQASEDFMDSDIAQSAMGGFLAFCGASRAISRGAGTAIVKAGEPVVQAAKAAGRGIGRIVLYGVLGSALITGGFYYFSRRRRKKNLGNAEAQEAANMVRYWGPPEKGAKCSSALYNLTTGYEELYRRKPRSGDPSTADARKALNAARKHFQKHCLRD
jgi:hypothetical protein